MEPESLRRHVSESLTAGRPLTAAETAVDLRAAVYEVLRCAFQPGPSGVSADFTDDGTRDAVRELCAMARANDVRAESLIVAIKAGWRQMPESNGTTRLDAEVTLAELITLCIKEYYLPQRRS